MNDRVMLLCSISINRLGPELDMPLIFMLKFQDVCLFDTLIWEDISFIEEIDFTAIQLGVTPKPACVNQYTEHIVKEEPSKPASDDRPYEIMKSLSQNKCIDLNSDLVDQSFEHIN